MEELKILHLLLYVSSIYYCYQSQIKFAKVLARGLGEKENGIEHQDRSRKKVLLGSPISLIVQSPKKCRSPLPGSNNCYKNLFSILLNFLVRNKPAFFPKSSHNKPEGTRRI